MRGSQVEEDMIVYFGSVERAAVGDGEGPVLGRGRQRAQLAEVAVPGGDEHLRAGEGLELAEAALGEEEVDGAARGVGALLDLAGKGRAVRVGGRALGREGPRAPAVEQEARA